MTHLDDNGSLLLDDFTSGYKNSEVDLRPTSAFAFAFEDHFDHNHFELTSNIKPINESSLAEDVVSQPPFLLPPRLDVDQTNASAPPRRRYNVSVKEIKSRNSSPVDDINLKQRSSPPFTPFSPVTSHFPKTRESQARVQSGSGVSPHRNLSDTKSSRDEDDNEGKHLETRSQALEVTTRTRRLRVSAVSVTPCRQLRGVELKLEVVPPKNKYTGSQIKPRANCSHVNPEVTGFMIQV